MIHRGSPNWPPIWTRVVENRKKTVTGEVGVLKYVHANPRIPANKCFLVIEYEKEPYVGCLIFDDLSFCAQIAQVLRSQSDRPIKDIGDLDVLHTL